MDSYQKKTASPKVVKKYLDDSFILYLPKDIVAGDFYWMESVGDWVLFAACDCTGHGVPGALVSVVCHNALNRAVKEYNKIMPAEILDVVAELVDRLMLARHGVARPRRHR
jgi:serine phosphatase RsbU (regulator of sigma subunit)